MLETLRFAKPVQPTVHRPPTTLTDPFVFVPITQQEAAKGRGAAKRIVRAHVTRVQHAKSSTLSSTQDLQTWTVRPYIHRDAAVSRRRARVNTKKPKRDVDIAIDTSETELASPKGRSSSIVPFGTIGADPFWTYPVDYQPELSPIFAHYVQNVAVDIPDLDGPNDRGLLRRMWFPLAMTEAATMYAVLLMAASHYCIVNPTKAVLIDILHLKARALSEINAALANPKRAITDSMIGAVMKMAAYKAIFGDSAVFNSHMKGLQQMLKIRGGLSTLGLDGLLERMLVWIDLNASHLTGMPLMIGGDDLPTTVSFAAPDPYHFAGIS